jgi:transposase InsO family protein
MAKLVAAKHKWPLMRQAVREFIRECPCCQKMSAIKIAIHTSPFTTSSNEAMEVINIDFVGPFHNKKYILVMVDTFTRWTELFCCIDATAQSAAESLLSHFGRFGCPRAIRSDRGSHFANEIIEQFLQLTGVGHNLTLAYSSQENAKVERVNKEVNRHLRAFVYKTCSIQDYERGIPFVQRIINSAPNHTTGITPAQLLFGNMIDLDRSIILPYPERPDNKKPTQQLVAQMLATQDRLSRMTRELQQKEDQIHMNSNSEPITEFEIGSFVLVQRREGLPSRLHTLWLGPMKILDNEKSEYRLLNLITMKEKIYHAQHMKKFIFNPLNVDPADVARRDYLEFFIEKILEHRGNLKRLTTMEFLVQWTTYDASHNTWEPYSNLRKAEPLHNYLRAKNLISLIPKEFR